MTDFKKFIFDLTSVSTESWDKFSTLFKPRVLKKGDYFIKEGQIAKELAFLEDGIIRVFYRNDKAIEYNKQQALTNCNILVAKYSEIQAFYSAYPDIERVARILAEHFFVEKEQREIEIVLLDAEKRYPIFQKKFPDLEQQIPQYHIASYLGITPTQLSRIRKKLSKK
ncbi:MAG: Crp/Fnr family transcriptional regulator [Cytophagales bacterium]|nr:MAG: Crp/Fnr family transcriptional regulator [Cytophagales bacterium]